MGDLDGGSLQEKASELGLLCRKPHEGNEWCEGEQEIEDGQETGEWRCAGNEDCECLFPHDAIIALAEEARVPDEPLPEFPSNESALDQAARGTTT